MKMKKVLLNSLKVGLLFDYKYTPKSMYMVDHTRFYEFK